MADGWCRRLSSRAMLPGGVGTGARVSCANSSPSVAGVRSRPPSVRQARPRRHKVPRGAGAQVSAPPRLRPARRRPRTPRTDGSFLSPAEAVTLGAAVARIVPASGPGDWSAADLGVVDYIDNLLSGFGRDPVTGGIYPGRALPRAIPGGRWLLPVQAAQRVKTLGWRRQVFAWQGLYTAGLAGLDEVAGGDFAAVSAAEQRPHPDCPGRSGVSVLRGTLRSHDGGHLLAPGLRGEPRIRQLAVAGVRRRRARGALPDHGQPRVLERLRRCTCQRRSQCPARRRPSSRWSRSAPPTRW